MYSAQWSRSYTSPHRTPTHSAGHSICALSAATSLPIGACLSNLTVDATNDLQCNAQVVPGLVPHEEIQQADGGCIGGREVSPGKAQDPPSGPDDLAS
jgi:hypothetical protein